MNNLKPLDMDETLRRLQYRLQRQGMLELDVWLSGLHDVLASGDKVMLQHVECLLTLEVPVLLAMQSGKHPIPQELQAWLS
ncbi:MAG: succinate dehydrogenase assembly factor 2 [Ghiorsea sp.]|nr:succinate dehydrogenase assembly factor 2 [Ghiorsea sp.]